MTRGMRAAPKRARRAPRASTHRTPPPTAGFLVSTLILGLALAAAALLHREALHAPFFADDFLFLDQVDRKSTRLNSSHSSISYAVFCLKKKKKKKKNKI